MTMKYEYNNFDMVYTISINEMKNASDKGSVVLISTTGKSGSWKEFNKIKEKYSSTEIEEYFKLMRKNHKRFRISYFDPSTMDHFKGVAIIK